jgi:Spy/CpxP family protein refolding chaperone
MTNTRNLQTLLSQTIMTVIVSFSMISFATAQTTPGTPTTPEQKKQAPQPGTMQEQQQGTQQGWQWFDDNATRNMKLDDARMKELREMDTRYRREYDVLGATPWTNSDYQALTDRRNADIQRVLTPEQYKQWSSRSSTRGTSPLQTPSNTTPDR